MRNIVRIFLAFALLATASPDVHTTEDSDDLQTVEIHEIKRGKLPLGIYRVKGYVSKIYVCPPCPPPNLCKPCMRNNVVVSERRKRVESYSSLGNEDVVIFAPTARRFVVGRRYTLVVRITDAKSTGDPIGDVHLVEPSREKASGPSPMIAESSYIACGCGCCGGVEPDKRCLYHSKGDSLEEVIQADRISAHSPSCPMMGCSKGVRYIYCD